MKKDIHPEYHEKTTITCACGAVFETGSTVKDAKIEICSQCHPFYTGKKKFIDTTGRVDRFKKLTERAKTAREEHHSIRTKKASRKAAAEKTEK